MLFSSTNEMGSNKMKKKHETTGSVTNVELKALPSVSVVQSPASTDIDLDDRRESASAEDMYKEVDNAVNEEALLSQESNIEKWDVDDVYNWLSTVYDGQLKELAEKFKNANIRGRALVKINENHLTNNFGIELEDQLQFEEVRKALFGKNEGDTRTGPTDGQV